MSIDAGHSFSKYLTLVYSFVKSNNSNQNILTDVTLILYILFEVSMFSDHN